MNICLVMAIAFSLVACDRSGSLASRPKGLQKAETSQKPADRSPEQKSADPADLVKVRQLIDVAKKESAVPYRLPGGRVNVCRAWENWKKVHAIWDFVERNKVNIDKNPLEQETVNLQEQRAGELTRAVLAEKRSLRCGSSDSANGVEVAMAAVLAARSVGFPTAAEAGSFSDQVRAVLVRELKPFISQTLSEIARGERGNKTRIRANASLLKSIFDGGFLGFDAPEFAVKDFRDILEHAKQ